MTEKRPVIPGTILGFLGHSLRRIWISRKWWLLPLWVILAAIGVFLLLSGGAALLPAIYIAF